MDEPVSPRTSTTRSIPQCCCGSTDCAHLSRNSELLRSLERDVQTAAQLGQALLQRHEAYIADSEAERRRMAAKIETLEHEKADLEARNAKTVQENRALLDQLEALNNAASETDSHCHELTAALMETQEELQRMTNLAARTESLERQLAELEREQMELQNKLTTTASEEKSAVKRWRRAEQTIAALSEQIERIEKEAKEERERHVEVVSRMERRRAVERELETAAGRLKGAAAAKAGSHDKTGTSVVSHFVKDILQDNANLQLGIVELREMLMNSNDEVERLREQLLLHQPISEAAEEPSGPSLQKELGMELDAPQELLKPQEPRQLHIHNHYHAAPSTPKDAPKKGHLQRRSSKKRRSVVTPSHFAPPPGGLHTPRSSISAPRPTTPSSAATILSQTAVTIPSTKHAHRWSVASHQTNASMASSSVPSSPYSRRTSSIFDRMFSDAGQDSSRPTSPESNNDPGSPDFTPINTRGKGPARTLTTPAAFKIRSKAAPTLEVNADPSSRISEEELDNLSPICQDVITEEQETSSNADLSGTSTPAAQDSESSEEMYTNGQIGHGLRRATSHESLLSLRGMDIAVHARPSQMLFAPSSPSSQAIASLSNMVARPSISYRHDQDASAAHRSLLSGFAADQRNGGTNSRPKQSNSGGGIGRKVGGWVFGKWGFAPTPTRTSEATAAEDAANTSTTTSLSPNAQAPTTKDGRAGSSSTDSSANSSSTAATEVPSAAKGLQRSKSLKQRMPGVNQSGPIFGISPASKAPCKVVVKQDEVDVDALRESLAEAGNSPVRTEPQIRIEPPPPETTAAGAC
ncbi:hypothetical protein MPH_04507 [Macrophomina phaseolina MS6]|uniref:Uncharacterized protein n=2 Tax=Macrophomina phaseolina TaxID=35725 RepID=K2RZU7_MACPH|nr:hypothetical protein MPH_04507 [Macrophomina phaseolina MS6]KAH7065294.1 hypothetical protein B0J12DRAFT_639765 [Macrophomina phaseolina]